MSPFYSLHKQLNQLKKGLTAVVSSFHPWQQIAFSILLIAAVIGAIGAGFSISAQHTVQTPTRGGSITLGGTGTPRFINPVLATSNVDQSLTQLIYAGLVTKNKKGEYVPELAKSYDISENGKTYTFTIKKDAAFHDGAPVTAEDVVFTVQTIQNSSINSPLRPEWLGVTVQKLDSHTVQFTLNEPYAGFIDLTTVGILPKHLWGNLSAKQFSFSDYNIQPIGAGPYAFNKIRKNKQGIPSIIELSAHKAYVKKRPYINTIIMRFFENQQEFEQAFSANEINGVYAVDPHRIQSLTSGKHTSMHTRPLPRVFALFFNQNKQPVFLNKEVMRAIRTAISKKAIVNHVLNGYGTPLCGPLPPHFPGYQPCEKTAQLTQQERIKKAQSLLREAEWSQNEQNIFTKDDTKLSFSIALPDTPELKETAEMIQNTLKKTGIDTNLQIYESGNFDQNIIRPRSYEALLFGHMLEHDSDLYAFWHSEGRNDPGLNVGLYTNQKVDSLLEKSIDEPKRQKRGELYKKIYKEFDTDTPALFLFSPSFLYATQGIYGINEPHIVTPRDRLLHITKWHVRKDNVWKNFPEINLSTNN